MDNDLEPFVRTLWQGLAASAGLGVVTMAVVQMIKDLLPVRTAWQRSWIQAQIAEQQKRTQPAGAEAGGDALHDLVNLATGGNERALYGLPIDQLAGQLNAAAQTVLDFPTRHQNLLRVLAAGANADDLTQLLTPPPQARTLSTAVTSAPPAGESERLTQFIDARNRVVHQVQRNLDAVQIAMTFRWQLCLQLLSIVISVLLAAVGAIILRSEGPWNQTALSTVAAVGVLGGFFSSVVRDLTAALQAVRGRSR